MAKGQQERGRKLATASSQGLPTPTHLLHVGAFDMVKGEGWSAYNWRRCRLVAFHMVDRCA